MYAPRTRAGFTLIELMIVIAVVAIAMAAAGPAFGAAFADRRSLTGTQDVMRIGRQAYWNSVRYRRAHVVSFTGMTGAGSPGRVELLRGDTNSCHQNWVALRAIDPDCGDRDSRCVDWVDLDTQAYQGFSGRGPVLTHAGGDATKALCYRPNGSVMVSNSLATGFAVGDVDNDEAGGLVFEVETYDSDNPDGEGLIRRILFPLGGTPRRIR